MKDELPPKANKIECSIINLENSHKQESHWVAYKNGDKEYYFNSYGKAVPPKELVKYLGPENLAYNSERFQNYNKFRKKEWMNNEILQIEHNQKRNNIILQIEHNQKMNNIILQIKQNQK